MFMYVYFIQPLIELSKSFNTPLNAFEPFISLMNNGFFSPLVALTYLILIIDHPKLCDYSTLILFRCGRIPWLIGQLFFLLSSALTFMLFLLFTSMLSIMNNSFIINSWSLVSRYITREENLLLRNQALFATIDESVINQSRPYSAIINAFLLGILFMLFVGIIKMLFTLFRKKVLGVFIDLILLALGLVLWVLDMGLKWLLPVANSVYGWHYDKIYNTELQSILYSYLYFLILITVLIAVLVLITKRCSFYITGGTD